MTTLNPQSAKRAGRKEWIALSILCLPLMFASMDVAVLFFALARYPCADGTANRRFDSREFHRYVRAYGKLAGQYPVSSIGAWIFTVRCVLVERPAFGRRRSCCADRG